MSYVSLRVYRAVFTVMYLHLELIYSFEIVVPNPGLRAGIRSNALHDGTTRTTSGGLDLVRPYCLILDWTDGLSAFPISIYHLLFFPFLSLPTHAYFLIIFIISTPT
jgi:hypothetical protein